MKDTRETDFSFSSGSRGKSSRCFRTKILPQFGSAIESASLASYVKQFERILSKLLSEGLCFEDEKDFLAWIQESLPVVKWEVPENSPDILTLCILCTGSKLQKTDTLLLELIKKLLIPEKEIPILSFQHLYFHFENFPQQSLLLMELELLVEDSVQHSFYKKGLPLLAKEISHLVKTPYFAHHFLEAKSLSQDFKMSLMHQDLVRLLQKFSYLFDQSIFIEVKRLLALASQQFLESRAPRHLAKVLAAHHMTRKIIMRATGLFPEERHLQLRVAPTRLHFLFGSKSVVGLIITISLLDRYEFFEEKHVLLAVQKIIPSAQLVKGSYYSSQAPQDMIRTLYLEIEKKDAEPITLKERGMLKTLLANELKASVEKLIPSIFMMRNEEEVMKNILILSQELKYLSDFPQVMISFEQQTNSGLIFTVIMVRALRKNTKPLDLLFQKIESNVEFIPDRTQVVGYLRKKHPKEASTFRLRIQKESSLLRADSSVNFYLARQRVIRILQETVGEVRDYNGGMILQQVEQFSELKNAFPETAQRYPDLLEDFFYALTPIEMQATLSLGHLHTLFRLLLEAVAADLPKRESYVLKVEQKKENIFVLLRTKEASYREYVQRALSALEIFPKSLCSTHVDIQGSYCTGFIYDCQQSDLQGKFIEAIRQAVHGWQEKLSSLKVLRLSYLHFVLSLDPRIGGDENSTQLLELLFEGLMRIDSDGIPVYAIAKSHEVSADHKRYIFKLRDSLWSNGDRVTAHDFEYSWKKILSPDFSTPFAYLFYPIRHARLAKEGKIPLDEVGVKAVDDWTLIVELDHPTPYFLELTAFTLYSPVNHRIDRIHPNWAGEEGKGYVCNGSFQLKKRSPSRGYELVKNPFYWNAKRIELDQVLITQNNNYTAQQMFKNGEIDWLGRPLFPWDSSGSGYSEKIETTSTPRIFWYVFNVRRFPFSHPKLRQAFAYGIDRAALIEELHYEGSAAETPLPYAHTLLRNKGIVDGDKEKARALFEEALQELKIKKGEFPVVTIIQATGEIRNKTAHLIKRQWQELFGIHCNIEVHEWGTIFDRMTHGDYQIGAMNWKAWINDPSYTLNAFRYASERVNFAKWENEEYQTLLARADLEIDSENRLRYLESAEEILLREMPVIPIYYEAHQFMRKKRIKVDVNPLTGYVDFSTTKIVND